MGAFLLTFGVLAVIQMLAGVVMMVINFTCVGTYEYCSYYSDWGFRLFHAGLMLALLTLIFSVRTEDGE